jgi:hypothetical protein
MARTNRNGRNNRKGGNAMAYGTSTPATPEIEQQAAPHRVEEGKGLNFASFSDEGSSFDIFEPHRPHENPAGHYSIVEGAGVDNTRTAHVGRRGRRNG